MLKFSGYPYLIRGQPLKICCWQADIKTSKARNITTLEARWHRHWFWDAPQLRGDTQYQAELEGCNDARTGIPPRIPEGAMCVQRFDDSLNSAIHITYRISLRSSSMPEPRDPLLKVFTIIYDSDNLKSRVWGPLAGTDQPKPVVRRRACQSNKGK